MDDSTITLLVAFSLVTVVLNVFCTAVVVKLFTEFAKERFKTGE